MTILPENGQSRKTLVTGPSSPGPRRPDITPEEFEQIACLVLSRQRNQRFRSMGKTSKLRNWGDM